MIKRNLSHKLNSTFLAREITDIWIYIYIIIVLNKNTRYLDFGHDDDAGTRSQKLILIVM